MRYAPDQERDAEQFDAWCEANDLDAYAPGVRARFVQMQDDADE